MSILIKGMEMPKSCDDCKLRQAVGCCGNLPHNTRMPNCPLSEVPIHGRLIDADEMSEKAFKMSFGNRITEYGLFVLNRAIQEMPTVIKGEQV